MLILYIIIFIIIVGCIIYFLKEDEYDIVMIFAILLVLDILGIITLTTISFGEKTYTGYIYSTEDVMDKTNVHIRFSKEAGKDEQPVFCVKNGSDASERFKEMAGSDTKVKVKVPSGFAMNMWYGQCPIEAELVETTGEEK